MEHIPTHLCLKLLFVSEQILSGNVSRHLITMEKIKEPKVITIYFIMVLIPEMQYAQTTFSFLNCGFM